MEAPAFVHLFRDRHRSRWKDALPRALTREGIVLDQHVREGRIQRSLVLVASLSSILAGLEVAYQHYRGSYSQRKMYTPVLVSPLLVGVGAWAVLSRRAARTVLPVVSILTFADGVWGFIYHVRGIARKPGGWRIPLFNMIMGPPLFAPLLFTIPAYIGVVASMLRREDDPRGFSLRHPAREGRFQKHVAGATAFFALLAGAEAFYSHYKNAYKYKMQWTPVAIAPLLVGTAVATVCSPRPARTLLPVASALAVADGTLGFYYHSRGVVRRAGGWRHFLYNFVYGPPVFAPLLLSAAGMLGGLASLLRRER